MKKDTIAHIVVGLPLTTIFSYKIHEMIVSFIQTGKIVLGS